MSGAKVGLIAFADERCWVAWRNEDRNGRLTKEPFRALGRRASHADPDTWLTLSAAEQLARRIVNGQGGGIGIMLGSGLLPDYSLGGLDLDRCRDPRTGAIEAWARELIREIHSYCEVSPSGTGEKIYFLYRTDFLPELRQHMGGALHGKKWARPAEPGDDGHAPAIELHLTTAISPLRGSGNASTMMRKPLTPNCASFRLTSC